MTVSLYLDGCSFTYGTGLSSEFTLGHLFANQGGYNVTNNSRPGKSNLAIALDTYDNISKHDVIVIGWSFSSRTYLKYNNMDIDLLPTKWQIKLPESIDSQIIEESYQDLHKQIYSFFDVDHYNNISDMLLYMTYQMAVILNKKVVFFSWDKRNVKIPLYYPHIILRDRLPCGHLNKTGTKRLYEKLQVLLSE